ncbi:hypothetical protein LOD99_15810 [Oopsacas minuta]|uniref:Uncharacterized protein n=1 Tax=Oopsacas minuta TaxID=111878 RepID=A0AAV7KA13_9METZ|nr:hypothetical protein LOD99_15810 [Oopsacas minuta]
MASIIVPEDVTIFQQARDTIDTDINEIVQYLIDKKVQLFEEITNLEDEYKRKQQQTQKEIQKLDSLLTQTEELGENNLLKVQHKLVTELQEEIEKLNLNTKRELNYNIEVKWKCHSKGVTFGIIDGYCIQKVSRVTNSTKQMESSGPNDYQDYSVDDHLDSSGEGQSSEVGIPEGGYGRGFRGTRVSLGRGRGSFMPDFQNSNPCEDGPNYQRENSNAKGFPRDLSEDRNNGSLFWGHRGFSSNRNSVSRDMRDFGKEEGFGENHNHISRQNKNRFRRMPKTSYKEQARSFYSDWD